ncbi:hypothetical protein [Virgibacillus halodenitrificans]|uniref:Uncharacterized protein n=1 Tax=Virgibacillus halodenitrificans TaxID=1482 RepID=A0ABR7VHP2_VIRHA|nr:hypothetical protein [Virgibacillus halodenitrificans]MBD1221201.1 hypothetical protein [Virgibacillus halodenitrificans]
MAAFSDRDDQLEVDRMINEGLGGGFIIHDYDVKRLEVYPRDTPLTKNSPQFQDRAQVIFPAGNELMESL